KMARQRLKQEMVNILSKLRREAADVKKEEAATKSRIDSLRKYLLEGLCALEFIYSFYTACFLFLFIFPGGFAYYIISHYNFIGGSL
uniref:Uncharacterized protein n=1 Tax=Parascaris univalens TaxID=6257 RepID=A0A914ZY46_PARUN